MNQVVVGDVDDPVLALRGTPDTRQATAALAMLTWAVLGIDLAINKGQLSTTVNWIGARFTVMEEGTKATEEWVGSRLTLHRHHCGRRGIHLAPDGVR